MLKQRYCNRYGTKMYPPVTFIFTKNQMCARYPYSVMYPMTNILIQSLIFWRLCPSRGVQTINKETISDGVKCYAENRNRSR